MISTQFTGIRQATARSAAPSSTRYNNPPHAQRNFSGADSVQFGSRNDLQDRIKTAVELWKQDFAHKIEVNDQLVPAITYLFFDESAQPLLTRLSQSLEDFLSDDTTSTEETAKDIAAKLLDRQSSHPLPQRLHNAVNVYSIMASQLLAHLQNQQCADQHEKLSRLSSAVMKELSNRATSLQKILELVRLIENNHISIYSMNNSGSFPSRVFVSPEYSLGFQQPWKDKGEELKRQCADEAGTWERTEFALAKDLEKKRREQADVWAKENGLS